MTENDTFWRLKRLDFDEVFSKVQTARKRRNNINADIKILRRCGWTYKEYVDGLKGLINRLADKI